MPEQDGSGSFRNLGRGEREDRNSNSRRYRASSSESFLERENGDSGDDTGLNSRENTRNVTVAIQYSWLNDMRDLAPGGATGGTGPLSAGTAGADLRMAGERAAAPGGGTVPDTTRANTTQGGLGEENGDTFVMSFTDVPDSTSYARFQEVISIAAQFAMSRVTRRFSILRGLSKESFEKLPVKKLSDMGDDLCSICYDEFEDDADSIGSKRNRDSELSSPLSKKQRLSENPATPMHDYSTEEASVPSPGLILDPDTEQELEPPQEPRTGDEGSSTEVSEEPVAPVTESAQAAPVPFTQEVAEAGTSPDAIGDLPTDTEDYKHSPTELPCGHIFGRDCIFKWTQEHNSCPICRARIVEENGLNQHSNDSAVVMDDFDRQSFERIRQLIYGENATNTNTNTNANANTNTNTNQGTVRAGDGGIASQRQGVLVIRPTSTVFYVNPRTATNTNEGTSQSPATEPSTEPSARVSTSATTPQTQLQEGIEALGVIPLALFGLTPPAAANTRPSASNSVESNIGDMTHPTGLDNNNSTNNNSTNGADPTQMNRNDVSRLIDMIANLTGRNSRRNTNSETNLNTTEDTTNASSRARETPSENTSYSQPHTGATNISSSRLGLLDFLGRGRRIRSYSQNTGQRFLDTISEVRRGSVLGGRSLFSTGVASFRDRTGVRTVDSTGDMTHTSVPVTGPTAANANTSTRPSSQYDEVSTTTSTNVQTTTESSTSSGGNRNADDTLHERANE